MDELALFDRFSREQAAPCLPYPDERGSIRRPVQGRQRQNGGRPIGLEQREKAAVSRLERHLEHDDGAGSAQPNEGLDIDSPSWFELADADGTISDGSDPALVEALRPTGIKLTPLVSNQFDSKLTSAFLRSAAAKTRFIANLVAKLSALHVAGVNVDFEGLAGGDRALYTDFIRSLTAAAHKAGLSVSVDLPRGDVLWDVQTAYDQKALAGIVDMIMMMAYDQHWEGGDDAGSVAELDWVEEGVKQFLAYGIPRGKLMLGIPFYAREWRIDGSGKLIDSEALIMRNLSDLIQTTGAKGVYDSVSGQMKYTYSGHDGYTHVFSAETRKRWKRGSRSPRNTTWPGLPRGGSA